MKHIYNICFSAVCGILMYLSQVVMASLPNFELVSLLVIVFSRYAGDRIFLIVSVFVLLEGITYGFGLWWISYLYIWFILAFVTYLFRKVHHLFFWVVLAGLFGLCFGTLTAIPYLFISNLDFVKAYIIAGIPFDIAHAGGNIILTAILYVPLTKTMKTVISFKPFR